MTPVPRDETVFVESPARLHFGLLDLRGSLGRRFGGIGAAAPAPTLLVSASQADRLTVTGEDCERATNFAKQFLEYHGAGDRGARLSVHRALPPHAGLGSGTQLALSVARALAALYGFSIDVTDLARAVGRAQRSAIGTWTFAGGGLVVEGGRRNSNGAVAPLLSRLPFPASWRCVVALPDSAPAINSSAEAAAFARLPAPSEHDVERVSHLVLMALLPALAEGDLATFGSALTSIQEITGRWFAEIQGGTFAQGPTRELIRRMTEWGVTGVGQSSWGPAMYGIVDGEEASTRLADRVRDALSATGTTGSVFSGPFRREGARVWWDDSDV
jgi:beta-ribofuranosylaminobenzene 5'-phosphate synthase